MLELYFADSFAALMGRVDKIYSSWKLLVVLSGSDPTVSLPLNNMTCSNHRHGGE